LAALSQQVVAKLKSYTGNDLSIIGVGGITDAASAQTMLLAGASLIQVYTGLIYQGPRLIREILETLEQ
jgi:dihydroorotate dehydrogenase